MSDIFSAKSLVLIIADFINTINVVKEKINTI